MAEEFEPDTTSSSSSSNDGYIGFLIFIKLLAVWSMIASTLLLRDIYYKLCKKGNSNSPRSCSMRERISTMIRNISLTQSILVCLSVGDFFSAFFVQFLSTWMVPSFINVAFAIGNVASCTAQGICSYFFYGLSVFSNASLAVAYCCFVKFGWKDDVRNKYLFPFTAIPLVCATIISVVPLFGQNYNYNGIFFCDISGSPLGCNYHDEMAAAGGSGEECARGAGSREMLLYVGVIPFMVAFVIIIVAVSQLIYSVLKQERRMDRFRVVGGAEERSRTSSQRKMTAQATKQGIYYVGAFGFCWIPWYIYAIVEYKHGFIPDWLGIWHLVTMPMQGALNALVYFRPRYESIRSKHPTESKMSNWFRVLRLPIPSVENCGCCFRVNGGDTGSTCNNQSSPSSPRAQNIMRKEGTEHEDKEGDGRGGSSIEETISGTNMDHSHLQHEYVDNVADKA